MYSRVLVNTKIFALSMTLSNVNVIKSKSIKLSINIFSMRLRPIPPTCYHYARPIEYLELK